MSVHLFGATSSPSCASFCLRQTTVLSSGECSATAQECINRGFYVDDCLVSTGSVEEAKRLTKELRTILSKFGFKLTKWNSNSEDALCCVPEDERCKSKALPSASAVDQRVLGVHWDVQADEFGIRIDIPNKPVTRRGILSMSHSLFDPLGFVVPVVLEVKLLLRELNSLDWDEELPNAAVERWNSWMSSLHHLEKVKVKRCFKPPDLEGEVTYELHHFADASSEAYGAVSYLRVLGEHSDRQTVCFIFR